MKSLTIESQNKLVVLLITLFFCVTSFFNPQISLLLIFASAFFLLTKSRPWLPLVLFIAIAPLSNISFLDRRLGGIPGLELLNMLIICSALLYFLSKRNFKMSFGELLMVGIILTIQCTAFIRSVPYLPHLNEYYGERMDEVRYAMSSLLKPILYFLPFILIGGYVRGKDKVRLLVNSLLASLAIASVLIIVVYLLEVPGAASWSSARATLGRFFGLHSNDIAIFYILAFPFVLANFSEKKGFLSVSTLFLSLAAVAILYSRTAYALVAFSTVVFLLWENQKRWIVLLGVLMAVYLSFAGSSVKERIMFGLDRGDVSVISAGRMNEIWPSVFAELKREHSVFFVGKGRYSIIYSNRIEKGHPHNMYLEAILDAGIIGLLGFLACYAYVIRKLVRTLNRTSDRQITSVLKASLISILVYLISGVSGRHFFPDITNIYLWLIMGLGLAAAKTLRTEENYSSRQISHHPPRIPDHLSAFH